MQLLVAYAWNFQVGALGSDSKRLPTMDQLRVPALCIDKILSIEFFASATGETKEKGRTFWNNLVELDSGFG